MRLKPKRNCRHRWSEFQYECNSKTKEKRGGSQYMNIMELKNVDMPMRK